MRTNLYFLMVAAFSFTVSCGENFSSNKTENVSEVGADDATVVTGPDEDFNKKPAGMTDEQFITIKALDENCRACHGLGDIRFIYSDSHRVNWEYLKVAMFDSKKTWLEVVYDVLDWPTDEAPEFDSKRRGSKQWMPIGAKRLHLADEMVDGKSLRKTMLETIQKELQILSP